MIKRVLPEDYFSNFSPEPAKLGNNAGTDDIKKLVDELKQKIDEIKQPEPKVIYVPQPYPVREVAAEATTNTNNSIPWWLITTLAITGIIAIAIVAIVIGRKD